MNDLVDVIINKVRMHADDTCVFIDYSDPKVAKESLEQDLKQ